MNTQTISSTSFRQDALMPAQLNEADAKIADLMQDVISQKEKKVQAALKGRINPSEGVLIGGDLFSMGFLGFQGAQIVKPALSKIAAIGMATFTCGVIAGAINIGESFVCLKEAIQAYKNNDIKLALRLFCDFFGLFAIGTVMILTSLAIKLAALSAIGAFFTTNPWLLPVLFFLITIPITVEIGYRIKNIWQSKDLAAQLETDNLSGLIQGENQKNPFHLKPLLEEAAKKGCDPLNIQQKLSEKMEQLQADMGVEAALATFELMKQILLKQNTDEQLKKLKKKIAEWRFSQYVRMLQQILYIAAFGVSMAALKPKLNTPTLNGTQAFSMSAANAIPLYMDIFWPFRRNVPRVVPMVEYNS